MLRKLAPMFLVAIVVPNGFACRGSNSESWVLGAWATSFRRSLPSGKKDDVSIRIRFLQKKTARMLYVSRLPGLKTPFVSIVATGTYKFSKDEVAITLQTVKESGFAPLALLPALARGRKFRLGYVEEPPSLFALGDHSVIYKRVN